MSMSSPFLCGVVDDDAVARRPAGPPRRRSARTRCPQPTQSGTPTSSVQRRPAIAAAQETFPHRHLKNVRLPAEFRDDEAGGDLPDLGRAARGVGTTAKGPGRRSSTSARTTTTMRGRARSSSRCETAEINIGRDRRVTLTSPIPAAMADSIVRERSITPARDPAAPGPSPSNRPGASAIPTRCAPGRDRRSKSDAGVAPWRQRAARRIDEARAALDAGDLSAAVTAAESALHEADEAPAPASSR